MRGPCRFCDGPGRMPGILVSRGWGRSSPEMVGNSLLSLSSLYPINISTVGFPSKYAFCMSLPFHWEISCQVMDDSAQPDPKVSPGSQLIPPVRSLVELNTLLPRIRSLLFPASLAALLRWVLEWLGTQNLLFFLYTFIPQVVWSQIDEFHTQMIPKLPVQTSPWPLYSHKNTYLASPICSLLGILNLTHPVMIFCHFQHTCTCSFNVFISAKGTYILPKFLIKTLESPWTLLLQTPRFQAWPWKLQNLSASCLFHLFAVYFTCSQPRTASISLRAKWKVFTREACSTRPLSLSELISCCSPSPHSSLAHWSPKSVLTPGPFHVQVPTACSMFPPKPSVCPHLL